MRCSRLFVVARRVRNQSFLHGLPNSALSQHLSEDRGGSVWIAYSLPCFRNRTRCRRRLVLFLGLLLDPVSGCGCISLAWLTADWNGPPAIRCLRRNPARPSALAPRNAFGHSV